MKSFHNIETQKTNRYWIGYSQIGTVRITGQSGAWYCVMGDSDANRQKGIAGRYVGEFATLEEVSKALDMLTIVYYEHQDNFSRYLGTLGIRVSCNGTARADSLIQTNENLDVIKNATPGSKVSLWKRARFSQDDSSAPVAEFKETWILRGIGWVGYEDDSYMPVGASIFAGYCECFDYFRFEVA